MYKYTQTNKYTCYIFQLHISLLQFDCNIFSKIYNYLRHILKSIRISIHIITIRFLSKNYSVYSLGRPQWSAQFLSNSVPCLPFLPCKKPAFQFVPPEENIQMSATQDIFLFISVFTIFQMSYDFLRSCLRLRRSMLRVRSIM